jgi:hypothetical protein
MSHSIPKTNFDIYGTIEQLSGRSTTQQTRAGSADFRYMYKYYEKINNPWTLVFLDVSYFYDKLFWAQLF